MAKEIIPESYYDCLITMSSLPDSLSPVSFIELHLFSYLGCVLALFKGNSVSEWGYHYSVTSGGFPYSDALTDSLDYLERRGFIEKDSAGLYVANKKLIEIELNKLSYLKEIPLRKEFIQTAINCALTFPTGSIRNAIQHSPGFALNVQIRQTNALLDSLDVELLYDEYKVISGLLGIGNKDLLSPAVIWLSARILRKED